MDVDLELIAKFSDHEDIMYVTYAICENDNNGQPFIEGFLQTMIPYNLAILRNLFGPSRFNIATDADETVKSIHCNDMVKEYGDLYNDTVKEINIVKLHLATHGLSDSMAKFPGVFKEHPVLAHRYLKVNS